MYSDGCMFWVTYDDQNVGVWKLKLGEEKSTWNSEWNLQWRYKILTANTMACACFNIDGPRMLCIVNKRIHSDISEENEGCN